MKFITAVIRERPWRKRTYYSFVVLSWLYSLAWLAAIYFAWNVLDGPMWAKIMIVLVLAMAMPDGLMFTSYGRYLRNFGSNPVGRETAPPTHHDG